MFTLRIVAAATVTLLAAAAVEAAPFHVPRAPLAAALGMPEAAVAASELPVVRIGVLSSFGRLGGETFAMLGRSIVLISGPAEDKNPELVQIDGAPVSI